MKTLTGSALVALIGLCAAACSRSDDPDTTTGGSGAGGEQATAEGTAGDASTSQESEETETGSSGPNTDAAAVGDAGSGGADGGDAGSPRGGPGGNEFIGGSAGASGGVDSAGGSNASGGVDSAGGSSNVGGSAGSEPSCLANRVRPIARCVSSRELGALIKQLCPPDVVCAYDCKDTESSACHVQQSCTEPQPVIGRDICICSEGYGDCNGEADDGCEEYLLDSNASHCGECGRGCPPDQICQGSECVCRQEGTVMCDGVCTDTSSDPNNCAACGSACATGDICTSGMCTTGSGGNGTGGTGSGGTNPSGTGGADVVTGGATNTGGSGTGGSSTGGFPTVVYGPEGPSCSSATGTECNGESCCTSIVLPAGSYLMGRGTEQCDTCSHGCPAGMYCSVAEQPEHPATVSSFALDKYEVTVGRFRGFVAAYDGSPPAEGSGAHPQIAGSGWDSEWDVWLPANAAELTANITCNSSDETWTEAVGANETYPMNCVNWYEAAAFCIWDGGRMPTEAEWEYAAAGGEANRLFPFGSDVSEPLPANYAGTDYTPLVSIGSYPAGNGWWGHADLAGSVGEWVLDWYDSGYYAATQSSCSDCVNLSTATHRVVRGVSWDLNADYLRTAYRYYFAPDDHIPTIGLRCARSP